MNCRSDRVKVIYALQNICTDTDRGWLSTWSVLVIYLGAKFLPPVNITGKGTFISGEAFLLFYLERGHERFYRGFVNLYLWRDFYVAFDSTIREILINFRLKKRGGEEK